MVAALAMVVVALWVTVVALWVMVVALVVALVVAWVENVIALVVALIVVAGYDLVLEVVVVAWTFHPSQAYPYPCSWVEVNASSDLKTSPFGWPPST